MKHLIITLLVIAISLNINAQGIVTTSSKGEQIIFDLPNILELIPIDSFKTVYYISTGKEKQHRQLIFNNNLDTLLSNHYARIEYMKANGKLNIYEYYFYIKPHSTITKEALTILTNKLRTNGVRKYIFRTLSKEEEELVNVQL